MKQLTEACSGLLPYGGIEAAVEGDPEALICVVEHNNSFTNYKCQRTGIDENGHRIYYIDREHRRNVEFSLMKAVTKFKL